ncbi:MAG: ABC transporter ATP-binding protein [Chloroflexi bacterium]|nr:ABC transporter ATP-binding protein [Chloroflexota bacterium]
MNTIEVQDLRRVYNASIGAIRRSRKEIVAVDGISFHIEQGELFGLLGPNGVGKTTTVKMLTTMLIPTSGRIRILGLDVVKDAKKLRPRIGFIFGGERGLYWRLSGVDNLRYFGSLYHLDPDATRKRIPKLLEMVGLSDRGEEKVEGYSRGMKQRLHIARALLHDPEVLFLDEPTLGLDPVGARDLRVIIRNLQAENKTILLTTHYMFEADALCQRIAVINKGKIVAEGSPAQLKSIVSDLSVIEVEIFGGVDDRLPALRALPAVDALSIENREQKQVLLIQSPAGAEAVSTILKLLDGVRVGKVAVREPTLEDAYIRLVEGEA